MLPSLVIFLSVLCSFSGAYKILVVFPLAGKSHSILGDGYVSSLANAGHEVTVITPFPKEKVPPNVHQVDISSTRAEVKLEELMNIATISKTLMKPTTILNSQKWPKIALRHENVKNLLHDQSQTFDAVIAEWFMTPLLSGFSAVYECPLIWSSSVDPHGLIMELIDEISNPAYSGSMTSNSLPPFNFVTRVQELVKLYFMGTVLKIIDHFYVKPSYYEIFEPAMKVRGRVLPELSDIAYNGSMMFFNAQPSTGLSYRLPQNAKYIGGYHVDPETKPLPKDLQILLDNAKDGAIYFSMGSNLKSKDIPQHIKEALIKMLGQLKQTVLWKFEEPLDNLPKNLHIIKWAPQQSILNHTNVRIFITHGGKLSTTEAIHCGVPVIGVPIFGDQFSNMNMAVTKGYGLKADYGDDMAENLGNAINQMLSDKSYSKKAKELSEIFHDLPVTPRQELVHWVEHVIRTKGAPHLRSSALLVPWYQKMYLDLAALVLLVLYITYKICKLTLCRKKSVVAKKNKTN